MKKMITFRLLCICILILVIACTNKKEIELQISEIKNQIRLIDEQIFQLESKRGLLSSIDNRPDSFGEKISRIKINPEINRLKSERELLLLKLKSLLEKL